MIVLAYADRQKLCELHRTWYSRGCRPDACETEERNDVTIVEFRPDGFLHRHWYKNPLPISSEWTNLYEYNDANQLSVVRIMDRRQLMRRARSVFILITSRHYKSTDSMREEWTIPIGAEPDELPSE